MITDFQYALTSIVLVPFFTAIGAVPGSSILHKFLLRITRGMRINSRVLTGVYSVAFIALHVALTLHTYTTLEGWNIVASTLYGVTVIATGLVVYCIESKG